MTPTQTHPRTPLPRSNNEVLSGGKKSVRGLAGVGPAVAEKLARLGIETVDNLVWHTPRTWIDLTKPQSVGELRRDVSGVVRAKVRAPRLERTKRRNFKVFRAELEDADGNIIPAIWFNQPFLANQLKEGTEWVFWGTTTYDFANRCLSLASPKFTRTLEILPVYPETEGLSSRQLIRLIKPVLATYELSEYLPAEERQALSLPERLVAIKTLHVPNSTVALLAARRRLALDEMVRLIALLTARRAKRQQGFAPAIPVPTEKLVEFTKQLPFQLTDAQRRSSWEILKDIERPIPMARILLGDVGSGKTVVAAMAAYATLLAGKRVIWLAPTQILAEQHVANVKKLMPSGVAQPLLVTAQTRKAVDQQGQFLIGTHALFSLIEDGSEIGLVIVDEQHRFGVKQRQQLLSLGGANNQPHLLTMTATPIPRSLALTVFGDLDCSFLDEAPHGRKPVVTRVIEPNQREQAYDVLVQELERGHQAFVVCPFIDEQVSVGQINFEAEAHAVTKRFEAIRKDPRFSKYKVALLHGRMKADEKQSTMAVFAAGEIQVLVATSLIEVGIDVPNATILVVEGAEKFGLAQLHQLRGRVGRSDKQSLCICVAEDWSPISQQRLAAFAKSTNGFVLAEYDLQLRGPGDLLGDIQAGLPPLKLARLTDTVMVGEAKSLVTRLRERAQKDNVFSKRFEAFLKEGDGGVAQLD